MYFRFILAFVLLNSILTTLKAQELNRQVVLSFYAPVQRFELANNQDDSIRFTLSGTKYEINNTGGPGRQIKSDTTQNSLAQHLHIYPRNIVLGPGESQTIVIQLIRTGLTPGDYTTGIYIKGIGLQSNTVYDTEVPVIIQSGKYQMTQN